MSSFALRAAEAALRKMFRPDGWLDITVVQEALKACGVVPPATELQAVRMLHCHHWNEMSVELRNETARVVLGWFDLPPFEPMAADAQLASGGVLKRLFAGH